MDDGNKEGRDIRQEYGNNTVKEENSDEEERFEDIDKILEKSRNEERCNKKMEEIEILEEKLDEEMDWIDDEFEKLVNYEGWMK